MLRRVLTKLFADRQIAVDPGVVGYIVTRMERSYDAANRIVAALDQAALAENRAVTRRLAADVLAEIADGAQGTSGTKRPPLNDSGPARSPNGG